MTKNQINLPIVIALIVVIGAASFFGGMQFQKRQLRQAFNGQGNFQRGTGNMMMERNGGGAQAGARIQNMRPVNGEIISADGNSITVKLDDGSSKIVMISDLTQINKADQVEKSALTVGQKVAVFGAENNGTVTANMVQLNPMNQMMMGATQSGTPVQK